MVRVRARSVVKHLFRKFDAVGFFVWVRTGAVTAEVLDARDAARWGEWQARDRLAEMVVMAWTICNRVNVGKDKS
jgi:hypothetical protein